jgi:methionyl-tRNA formyltransferase
MTAKPDAGDIVDQQAVEILPDDTAAQVFEKVTLAAASALDRSLPALLKGTAPRIPQDLARGSYYGGRKAEDGRIDWRRTAAEVHNLVRGVAPPYPGAFTRIGDGTLRILRTRLEPGARAAKSAPHLGADGDGCYAACADGAVLRIIEMDYDGKPYTASDFLARFGHQPINLQTVPT